MTTPRKLAGKNGRVTCDGTIVAVTKFSLEMKADKQDVTGSESGGAYEYADGLHGWSGSFDANYDAAQNPHVDPPDINEGAIIAAQFMVENTAGANGTYSGNIIVDKVKVDLVVAGKVTYSVDFTGTLACTKPTANIDS
jgi:hypothetical protein